MTTNSRPRAGRGLLAAAIAGATLAAGVPAASADLPAAACSSLPADTKLSCSLNAVLSNTGPSVIKTGTATELNAPTWRFSTGPAANDLPTPVIVAYAGQQIDITITNKLGPNRPLSLAIPQAGPLMWDDGLTGTKGADQEGVLNGASRTYTLMDAQPGTYLVEAGPTPYQKREVAMGLYAVLIVKPAADGIAYPQASVGSAYTAGQEQLVVLSEVDPAFNAAPDTYPFTSPPDGDHYHASYWLINDTLGGATVDAKPGSKVLVRYVNAGVDNHWMGLLGLYQARVAQDAQPWVNVNDPSHAEQTIDAVVQALPGGSTADTVISIPKLKADSGTAYNGQTFPLFDEGKELDINGAGMIEYLRVSDGLGLNGAPGPRSPMPVCDASHLLPPTGIVVSNPAVTVNGATLVEQDPTDPAASQPVAGNHVVISATRGVCAGTLDPNIQWSTDQSSWHDGSGNSVTLSASDVDGMNTANAITGPHAIYLRSTAAGKTVTGPVASTELTIDQVGPDMTSATAEKTFTDVIGGVKGDYAVTNGTDDVVIHATGDESNTGGANVASFRWTVTGAGVPATCVNQGPILSDSTADVVSTATIPVSHTCFTTDGLYDVRVFAVDSLGNASSDSAAVNDQVHVAVVRDSKAPEFAPTFAKLTPFVAGTEAIQIQQRTSRGELVGWNNGTLAYDDSLYEVRIVAAATDNGTNPSHIDGMVGSFDPALCTAADPSAVAARFDAKDGQFFDPDNKIDPTVGFLSVPVPALNPYLTATDPVKFYVRVHDAAGNWTSSGDCATTFGRVQISLTEPLAGSVNLLPSANGRGFLTARSHVARSMARHHGYLVRAEWFEGTDPGVGKGNALRAADGRMHSASERLRASIDISGWKAGSTHTVSVRVQDVAGNWSRPATVKIRVKTTHGKLVLVAVR